MSNHITKQQECKQHKWKENIRCYDPSWPANRDLDNIEYICTFCEAKMYSWSEDNEEED